MDWKSWNEDIVLKLQMPQNEPASKYIKRSDKENNVFQMTELRETLEYIDRKICSTKPIQKLKKASASLKKENQGKDIVRDKSNEKLVKINKIKERSEVLKFTNQKCANTQWKSWAEDIVFRLQPQNEPAPKNIKQSDKENDVFQMSDLQETLDYMDRKIRITKHIQNLKVASALLEKEIQENIGIRDKSKATKIVKKNKLKNTSEVLKSKSQLVVNLKSPKDPRSKVISVVDSEATISQHTSVKPKTNGINASRKKEAAIAIKNELNLISPRRNKSKSNVAIEGFPKLIERSGREDLRKQYANLIIYCEHCTGKKVQPGVGRSAYLETHIEDLFKKLKKKLEE